MYFFLRFQVGGHTRLLLLNQGTVIKPLNIRELDFYQNIPQDIQMFVPKYKGKSINFKRKFITTFSEFSFINCQTCNDVHYCAGQ